MAKTLKTLLFPIILILIIFGVYLTAYTVAEDEYGIVRQFGRIVDIKKDPGIYFRIPFIEDVSALPKNLRVYDVPSSELLTLDKKSLVVDNYLVWYIIDPLKFVQSVGTIDEMENRLDATVYSVVKNVMGTKNQAEIINAGDTDGNRNEVNKDITDQVSSQVSEEYGVAVLSVEIKKLDLPVDNEAAVYNRMISDREQIAATYVAEGELEASIIRNETDKQASIILSAASAESEKLRGEGEAEYMRILASAYNDPSEREFYDFYRSLEAARIAMSGKKVLILPSDSPIAKIFLNE